MQCSKCSTDSIYSFSMEFVASVDQVSNWIINVLPAKGACIVT